MTARQHHHVSQCYLKGFVADRGKPKLFVVDIKELKSFSTNPANVAVERDFHRVDIEGHEPDALENALADFEGKLDQSLRRIVAARSIADENDRAALFKFIALMAIKNPQLRETFRAAHEQTARIVMDLLTATPETWASHLERACKDGYIPATSNIPYEQIRDFVRRGEYRIETATSMHLGMELRTLDKILPLIFRRKWMLFRAPKGSTGFITSDHPMCLMWSDPARRGGFYGPGLGLAQTQLLFPVSSELALIGAFEAENDGIDADERLVAQINGSVILHAGRQVYARDSSFLYQWAGHDAPVCGDTLLENLKRLPRKPNAGAARRSA